MLALCCGNRSDADDLAQDALVKAYLALGQYSDRGAFRAWLFKIAHNTFLNHVASEHRTTSLDEAGYLDSHMDSDAGFRHQELYQALEKLPPRERSAITLYYLNGYSISEIARITDCNADAVKIQLSRGREKLRETISL